MKYEVLVCVTYPSGNVNAFKKEVEADNPAQAEALALAPIETAFKARAHRDPGFAAWAKRAQHTVTVRQLGAAPTGEQQCPTT